MHYIILISFLLSSVAYSKPIQFQRISPNDGFRGEVSINYDRNTGGTQDTTNYGGDLYSQHRTESGHLVVGHVDVQHSYEDGIDDGSYDSQHIRYRYKLLDQIEFDSFAHRERDTNANLLYRGHAGIGPYHTILDKAVNLAVGYAYVFERETYLLDPYEETRRIHWYMHGGVRIGPLFQLGGQVYSQVDKNDNDDHRLFLSAHTLVKPGKNWFIRMQCDTWYDSRPNTGMDNEGTNTTMSYGYEF